MRTKLLIDGQVHEVELHRHSAASFALKINGELQEYTIISRTAHSALLQRGNPGSPCLEVTRWEENQGASRIVSSNHEISVEIPRSARASKSAADPSGPIVISPISGIVRKILIELGSVVEKGDPLIVVEAMKMQITIPATMTGTIIQMVAEAGAAVQEDQELVVIEPIN